MRRFLTIRRLSLLFMVLFAAALTGVLVFQRVWLDPGERCEAKGWWYDLETRTCGQPIYIPDITGRPEGMSRAEASAMQNREKFQADRRDAAERRAVAADVEAQRERFEEARGN